MISFRFFACCSDFVSFRSFRYFPWFAIYRVSGFARFNRFVSLFWNNLTSENQKREMNLPIIREADFLKLTDFKFEWLDRSAMRVALKLAPFITNGV